MNTKNIKDTKNTKDTKNIEAVYYLFFIYYKKQISRFNAQYCKYMRTQVQMRAQTAKYMQPNKMGPTDNWLLTVESKGNFQKYSPADMNMLWFTKSRMHLFVCECDHILAHLYHVPPMTSPS